jgi:predicted DNA-binding mobile mystery protein A
MTVSRGSSVRAELEQMVVPFESMRRQINGVRGWLRTVRQLNTATVKELAGRMGVLKREVLRLEVAEERGQITLGKLREVANAMDCELVYTFVPKQTTFEELALSELNKKKEAREERIRKREREQAEKRGKRYADVSVLTLVALEVERELGEYGIKILGKKKPTKGSEGWGVRPGWGKGCVECQSQ